LEKLRAFRATTEREFRDSPAVHDLAERYLHLAMECVLDLGNHFIADAISWHAIQNELGDLEAFADWALRQLD
jgi:uncharacterized protein YutE (UPF0331/DUF86 family)